MEELIQTVDEYKELENIKFPLAVCMKCFVTEMSEKLHNLYCSGSCENNLIMRVCDECYMRKLGRDRTWIPKLEKRMDHVDVTERRILLSPILYHENFGWHSIVDISLFRENYKESVRSYVCNECVYDFVLSNISELSTSNDSLGSD